MRGGGLGVAVGLQGQEGEEGIWCCCWFARTTGGVETLCCCCLRGHKRRVTFCHCYLQLKVIKRRKGLKEAEGGGHLGVAVVCKEIKRRKQSVLSAADGVQEKEGRRIILCTGC